jgi:hypothetical protein
LVLHHGVSITVRHEPTAQNRAWLRLSALGFRHHHSSYVTGAMAVALGFTDQELDRIFAMAREWTSMWVGPYIAPSDIPRATCLHAQCCGLYVCGLGNILLGILFVLSPGYFFQQRTRVSSACACQHRWLRSRMNLRSGAGLSRTRQRRTWRWSSTPSVTRLVAPLAAGRVFSLCGCGHVPSLLRHSSNVVIC